MTSTAFRVRRTLAWLAAVGMLLAVPSAGALAQDDSMDPCPDPPPAADYRDRDRIPAAHLHSVDCLAHRLVVSGFDDRTYRPVTAVQRDQMASFLVRAVTEAGRDEWLPDPERHPGFADTAGNVHADNIRRLAAAGIVRGGPGGLPDTHYGPGQAVRRDQMASFLERTLEVVLDFYQPNLWFSSDDRQFADVGPDNPHFGRVNAAAKDGLVHGGPGGLPPSMYGPDLLVTRAQMASFVARMLFLLDLDWRHPHDVVWIRLVEPEHATRAVGETHTVVASVQWGPYPAKGAGVRFEVTGAHALSAGTLADDYGEATLAYTGTDEGEDTITVCVNDDESLPEDCDTADTTATVAATWVAS